MTTVQEIETAIDRLPRDQFYELITWIKGRFEDAWDRQIEEDVKSGKLDKLAKEALVDYRTGRTKPFPPGEKSRD